MKISFLIALTTLLSMCAIRASAQNSAQDLKNYLPLREEVKAMDLDALKKIAANPREKDTKRGIASYYVFLKTPLPAGDPAAGKKSVEELETAANTHMDPLTYVKLAIVFAQDNPKFDLKMDRVRSLRFLSIAWELADLSDRATGDNSLLTLIINNTLGIGDGLLADNANGKFAMKEALASVRKDALAAREHFKKLYNLSVKDEFPGSTNVERHYAQ